MSKLEKQVLELIKRNPGELAFVVDCPSYEAYVRTYTDAKISVADVEYSEEEYTLLHDYFKKGE